MGKGKADRAADQGDAGVMIEGMFDAGLEIPAPFFMQGIHNHGAEEKTLNQEFENRLKPSNVEGRQQSAGNAGDHTLQYITHKNKGEAPRLGPDKGLKGGTVRDLVEDFHGFAAEMIDQGHAAEQEQVFVYVVVKEGEIGIEEAGIKTHFQLARVSRGQGAQSAEQADDHPEHADAEIKHGNDGGGVHPPHGLPVIPKTVAKNKIFADGERSDGNYKLM